MSVQITLRLSEREADAFIRAHSDGREGWHAIPPQALQIADFKIAQAIHRVRADQAGENKS